MFGLVVWSSPHSTCLSGRKHLQPVESRIDLSRHVEIDLSGRKPAFDPKKSKAGRKPAQNLAFDQALSQDRLMECGFKQIEAVGITTLNLYQ